MLARSNRNGTGWISAYAPIPPETLFFRYLEYITVAPDPTPYASRSSPAFSGLFLPDHERRTQRPIARLSSVCDVIRRIF